jgi:lipopolysaccharide/colanic/teichoic acid biosynthesis glycosyltransferase
LPLIALAIKLDSPGPLFYTQERVGQGGRIFRVRKLRTMVVNAEQNGQAVWATKNDPRVTRVGKILRKMHVDEFPQFWNILRGEMSAVGPRPERPEFVAQLEHRIPFYRLRHAVKPGMAGWALVNAGYVDSLEIAQLRVEYDLYYIKHQSLWLDLWILFRTVVQVVAFGGR